MLLAIAGGVIPGWMLLRSARWRPDSCPRWTRGRSSSTTTCRWEPRWSRPTRCSAASRRYLLDTPDVQGYIRRTGAELGFFATESYTGDILVSLKPSGQRRPMDEIFDDLRDELKEKVPELEERSSSSPRARPDRRPGGRGAADRGQDFRARTERPSASLQPRLARFSSAKGSGRC